MNVFTIYLHPDAALNSGIAFTLFGRELLYDSEDRYSVSIDGVELRVKDPIYHIDSETLDQWTREN